MDKFLDKSLIKKFQKELDKCKKMGGQYGSDCAQQVILKYLRKSPGLKDQVYPWINYDWSYDVFIDNNYNHNKTGATPKGDFKALFKNPAALFKLTKGFTLDPNPNNKSKPGKSDLVNCDGNKGCETLNDIKRSYLSQKPPYPDKFFNKKLDGEYSSSYFMKTGTCLRNLDKKMCLQKGYNWVPNPLYEMTPAFLRPDTFKPGSCYQNKYGFLKNKSGFNIKLPKTGNKSSDKGIDIINKNMSKFKGALPSFVNDLASISPDKIFKLMKGESIPDLQLMKCPEEFVGSNQRMEYFCDYIKSWAITNEELVMILILIIILIMVLILIINKYISSS